MKKHIYQFIYILIGFILCQSSLLLATTDQIVSEEKGRILSVDNSELLPSNISFLGYQTVEIEILSGPYKGTIMTCANQLSGQIDLDQVYEEGDIALTAIISEEGDIINMKPVDLYRQNWLIALALTFVIILLIYARAIGINALISFVLSIIVLWRFFIRGLLNGGNPLLLTTLTVIILSAIIIFLVAGFTKKGVAAFTSTVIGLFITLILTHFFGNKIALYGFTQSYVQTLVSSGYFNLNIKEVFYAAIVLGASGAAMDIAMDIAASMHEIKDKKPEISFKELFNSGLTVGRHVIGTMSTTLLLAYSGSYLTLLMVFQVKNTSFMRMLNLKMVSAEIMRTLIGSTGLVIVAPLTAVISAYILSNNRFTR